MTATASADLEIAQLRALVARQAALLDAFQKNQDQQPHPQSQQQSQQQQQQHLVQASPQGDEKLCLVNGSAQLSKPASPQPSPGTIPAASSLHSPPKWGQRTPLPTPHIRNGSVAVRQTSAEGSSARSDNEPPHVNAQLLGVTSVRMRELSKNLSRALIKLERPSSVMIVAKVLDPEIVKFTRILACHLVDSPPRACSKTELTVYIDSKLRNHPNFNFPELTARFPHYQDRMRFWSVDFCANSAEAIDFIVTLGGDGTVLFTSWLFQRTHVPPIVPFHLGSLGFLTNFDVSNIRNVLERVLGCSSDGVRVNMRMRLSCTVWRASSRPNNPTPAAINSAVNTSVADLHGATEGLRKASITGSMPQMFFMPADDEEETLSQGPLSSASLQHSLSFAPSSSGLPSSPTTYQNVSTLPVSTPRIPNTSAQQAAAGGEDLVRSLLADVASSLVSNAFPNGYAEPKQASLPLSTMRQTTGSKRQHRPVPTGTFQILNDLVVDRGPSAFMSQLELFADEKHLTTVQADGLVVATPTGSTAYSMSANGSIVHPEVPSILVTPICPHTLSFRPMLLPDSVELKLQVPMDSRSTAWASFDGRHRTELAQGDFITISMSRHPLPTVCDDDQSADWFKSLKNNLHWNERTRQKGFAGGPPTSPL
ncbi:ATP-NAD kinase-like domain-containing protein [Zopfochytrium polystomum]|nr:ATP-NAD kinase-like domain-containing protein [Zopfochytrium polystomum]